MKDLLHDEKPASRALLVGIEEVLLESREALLIREQIGTLCAHPAEVLDALRANNYDLVIACHTLSQAEAAAVLEAIKTTGSRARAITFSKVGSQPTPGYQATVWSLGGPPVFLATVRQVLAGQMGKPSPDGAVASADHGNSEAGLPRP